MANAMPGLFYKQPKMVASDSGFTCCSLHL